MATLGNVVFYADNPRTLSAFWSGVFGYPEITFDGELKDYLLANGLTEADLETRGLAEDPEGKGPRLFFHHASGPKVGRNRLHMDIQTIPGQQPTREQLDAEAARIVALGGQIVRLVDQSWGPWPEFYYQMRDPEGNEFCLQ